MDLDRDGKTDLLSGSFAPGELFFFPGTADGGFAAAQTLRGPDGKPLRPGRASFPFACDWDGDGDLDLVVGNMQGYVFVVRNGGQGRALSFAAPAPLVVQGLEVHIGSTNAAPFVADWDRDGRADLLMGSGDGRVLFYRNEASQGEPVLAAPVELVGKSQDEPDPARRSLPRPGQYSKVVVWDWNDDGLTDLVVGDHLTEMGEAPVLSKEDERELADTLRESAEVTSRLGELERKAFHDWLVAKKIPMSESAAHAEDFQLEWAPSAQVRELTARKEALTLALKRYNAPTFEHGRIWVYLRQRG